MSARVETPLVTGLLRPVVLLPAGRFDTLTGREQQMALCHELAHLERADLWLGCVPALAERVFFFHPLVHLASREYAFSREAACDATVMQTLDAAPQEYGRLLLALGVARPQPGLTAAGAAWSFLNLKRRIAMLQDVSARSTRSRLVAAGAVGLAIAAMVPMQLAARPSGQTLFLTKVAAPAASVSEEQLKAGEPLKPSEIPAKAAQVKEGPPKSGELSFVMLLEDGQRTMSGSPDDVARAERHRRNGEPLLWFRYNGREYVVRDRDLLREARGFWNDVYNSGYGHDAFAAFTDAIKAAKLDKHGKLFEDQLLSADLGAFAEVGKLGAEIGSLAATKAFEALSAAGAGLAQIDEADLERQFLEIEKSKDHIEDHIEEKMRDFEQRFKHDFDHKLQDLEHRLRALEGPIREMTAPLEAWSGHHEAFAASVEKASRKAQEDMRALIERAIAAGLAQTVR
jgi:hypothetical protein